MSKTYLIPFPPLPSCKNLVNEIIVAKCKLRIGLFSFYPSLQDTLQEYLTSKHDALVGMACLGADAVRKPDFVAPEDPDDGELDLTGIDDDEIDG